MANEKILKSIMDKREGCWLCGKQGPMHIHHCWGNNPNRSHSDQDGLFIKLCPQCHEKAHKDKEVRLHIMQAAEMAWLKHYSKQGKDVPDFIKRYGKNVLE